MAAAVRAVSVYGRSTAEDCVYAFARAGPAAITWIKLHDGLGIERYVRCGYGLAWEGVYFLQAQAPAHDLAHDMAAGAALAHSLRLASLCCRFALGAHGGVAVA